MPYESADIVLLLIRVAIGVVFFAHGANKIKDMKSTSGFVGSLGFKPAAWWAWFLAGSEFFGGMAMVAGFLAKLAAIPMIITMVVALYFKTFKWHAPFLTAEHGGTDIVYILLAGLGAVLLAGAGQISVDGFLRITG
ncbi:DoxX family protein [Candidatus Woesearchaeota archaeon]|nr:DoxX family protein [Candidatus Woesearchaeota archaeon]